MRKASSISTPGNARRVYRADSAVSSYQGVQENSETLQYIISIYDKQIRNSISHAIFLIVDY